jgi:hypothetical protein
MELLAHRADAANGRVWPEFAELDCFACHHDLQGSSWRQRAPHLGERRPGMLTGSDWYTAMTPDILAALKADQASQALDRLRELMGAGKNDGPGFNTSEGRRQIAAAAKALAKLLHEATQQNPGQSDDAWLDRLSKNRRSDRSWDEATQRYLALLSLRPADGSLDPLIRTLRADVTFGPDQNSPRRFVPTPLQLKKAR